MLIKIIARGLFFCGPKSYLRQIWNVLDVVVVTTSVLSIIFDSQSSLKIFKLLRMVRILRPLRLINRNEGLKVAVSTLVHVFPNVFNIFIVSMLFYLIFGIFVVTF